MARFRKFGTLVGLEEENILPETDQQDIDTIPEIAELNCDKVCDGMEQIAESGRQADIDMDTVNNVQGIVKEELNANGGISETTAQVVDVVMESIYTRWGMGKKYRLNKRCYSQESFRNSRYSKRAALIALEWEEVEKYEIKDEDNFFIKICKHIANAFIGLWNWFRGLFGDPESKGNKAINGAIDKTSQAADAVNNAMKTLSPGSNVTINPGNGDTIEYSKYIAALNNAKDCATNLFASSSNAFNAIKTIINAYISAATNVNNGRMNLGGIKKGWNDILGLFAKSINANKKMFDVKVDPANVSASISISEEFNKTIDFVRQEATKTCSMTLTQEHDMISKMNEDCHAIHDQNEQLMTNVNDTIDQNQKAVDDFTKMDANKDLMSSKVWIKLDNNGNISDAKEATKSQNPQNPNDPKDLVYDPTPPGYKELQLSQFISKTSNLVLQVSKSMLTAGANTSIKLCSIYNSVADRVLQSVRHITADENYNGQDQYKARQMQNQMYNSGGSGGGNTAQPATQSAAQPAAPAANNSSVANAMAGTGKRGKKKGSNP